ncbi:MAG: hypothetical protein L7T62_07215 [Flavobacteriaceae bacterium]|nr:hypothetical protein [Flavobacteriaceae bacterium]
MNQYFSIINHRTLITLVISLVVPYLCYNHEIIYNIDLTLISIAIIFPLVFAIRGAFKRREKALEHLSKMKSALIGIQYLIKANNKMSIEEQEKGSILCVEIADRFMDHLDGSTTSKDDLEASFMSLVDFMEKNPETISNGLKTKINGIIQKVHEGMENALAIHIHRTPISLKAYCKVFIYIFPIIYTPTIIIKIGLDNPAWITYFVVILSEFILISLYNIQDDMEYPFDHKGLDDIKLDSFRLKK